VGTEKDAWIFSAEGQAADQSNELKKRVDLLEVTVLKLTANMEGFSKNQTAQRVLIDSILDLVRDLYRDTNTLLLMEKKLAGKIKFSWIVPTVTLAGFLIGMIYFLLWPIR
jgi:hypothetical protein